MIIKNSTFTGAEPTWANACVGDNGNPSYVEYAKGFSVSANILLKCVLERDSEATADELIYPICFNMRHSVELRLKGAVQELLSLSNKRNKHLTFDLSGSHDIENIWSFFKTNAVSLDQRFNETIEKVDQTILDIAQVDATGQTFRYPIDKDSRKHLIDIGGTISCRVLWEKFGELEKNLDELHFFIDFLKEEYSLGTYTSKLSRAQLMKLAIELPAKNSWGSAEFKEIKSRIMEQYGLSSNDFSKAVRLIKNNYEFAHLISERLELLGLSVEQLRLLIDLWVATNPDFKNRSTKIISSSSLLDANDFDEIQKKYEMREESFKKVHQALTPEYLAGMNSIYYFAKDLRFSEYYNLNYEYELKVAQAIFGDLSEIKRSFMHVFSKPNFIDNVLISLYFLNFNEFADSVVHELNLENGFDRVMKARDRSLFVKPKVCGY